MKRRHFLASSSTLAAGSLILPHTLYGKTRPASDLIRIGVIGAKGMGWSNVHNMLTGEENCTVTWICDVDDAVLKDRLNSFANLRPKAAIPQTTKDYRKLLESKEVDVVVIGTPDHWHARMFVDAVDAGKDVYVEKPIANTIAECRAMVAAQERTGRVVQVGQWQRSGVHYDRAMEIVRSGRLGQIRLVKVWAYQAWMKPVDVVADGPVPAGVDYDMWLGPAKKRPFNANRFHFNFRWFWDYAGGLMTDWGVHQIDIALLAMGAGAPKNVVATGGKFAYPNDASETPDTLQAVFEYDNFTMLWEHATGIDLGPFEMPEGIAFIGNEATLVLNRGGFRVIPEREFVGWGKQGPQKGMPEEAKRPEGMNYGQVHVLNFFECVRANTPMKCSTTVQSGAIAAVNAQMGNIAYKTGEKIHWQGDWRTGNFKENPAANALLESSYHNGWKMPMG